MSAKKSQAKKTLVLRQVRSTICTQPSHRDAVRGLGLRRIRHTVERQDTPSVRGLLAKVPFLVEIVEEKS